MTTTSPLLALPEPLDVVGMEAVSEAARSATLAQNRAGATRLEAAHVLVEQMTRLSEGEDELRDTAAREQGRAGASPRPAYARLDPRSRARDHLVAACQLTGWHAGRLVTAGVQIHTRLRLLRGTVGRGLLPEQLAIDIACRLAEVPDRIVAAVESDVIASITAAVTDGDRPGRPAVDAAIDEAVERHDPAAAQDAVDEAVEARTVRFRPGRNGMATLWGKLPIADAELLRQRIEADARAAAADGVPGTVDQLRADALAGLAVYAPAGQGVTTMSGSDGESFEIADAVPGADLPRPSLGNAASAAGQPIRITVISSIAQGMPNRVEFVHGAYSSFEWLCRELLAGDDTDTRVRFETIDPAPGVLDHPDHALRYLITPAMAERIRHRDGTCRHPGCTVSARDCDVDHVIAFNKTDPELGGPTTEWNLVCLCRKHHLEKTFGTNAYQPGPLGELIIITDTGHEHRTRPKGPLARARDEIREHAWHQHIDRLIDDDGYLTNPPGIDRPGIDRPGAHRPGAHRSSHRMDGPDPWYGHPA